MNDDEQQSLLAAEGFTELGMFEEACAEFWRIRRGEIVKLLDQKDDGSGELMEDVASKLIQHHPADHQWFAFLAWALRKYLKLSVACRFLEMGKNLDPEFPFTFLILALFRLQEGNTEEAKANLSRACELCPELYGWLETIKAPMLGLIQKTP